MEVTLIDSIGGDLTVVNSARVSFGKKKKKFGKGDERLISYLAKHGHWTPFGHPQAQFRISAPIFVARQLLSLTTMQPMTCQRRHLPATISALVVEKGVLF